MGGIVLPDPNDILQVMPWPIYRFMTDRDLNAVYEYLSHLNPDGVVAENGTPTPLAPQGSSGSRVAFFH
jgi:hypothetical protein